MDVAEFFLASRHQVYRAVLAVVGDDALATEAVVQAYAAALERWRDDPDAEPEPGAEADPDIGPDLDGEPDADADPLVWVLRRVLTTGPRGRRRSAGSGPAPDRPLRLKLRRLPRRPRLAVALSVLAGVTEAQVTAVLGRTPSEVAAD